MQVRVHENTPAVVHLTLPAPSEELSDEQLDAVAGGGTYSTAGTICATVSTLSTV
jgi:hypothetical protein